MALVICYFSIIYAFADNIILENIKETKDDHIPYDSFDSDFNSDDFEHNDYESTKTIVDENSTEVMSTPKYEVVADLDVEEVEPNNTINMKATKAYRVTGLKYKYAIQTSYVGTSYIFVSQSNSQGTTYLSRCTLNGTTATYKDQMVLTDFGHNQTLQFYSHNNKTYILIGCKSNKNINTKEDNYGNNLTIQVGRIQYVAGTTISSYAKVCRIVRLDCANTNGKAFDSLNESDLEKKDYIKTVIQRMDAALSSDKKYLVLAVRSIHGHIQYSYYDFNAINNLLDKVDGKSPNYINCNGNTSMKNACKFYCIQKHGNRIIPNGSCQGIEFTNAYSIYMSSGAGTKNTPDKNNIYHNRIPKIAKMVKNSNGGYSYSACIRITNTYTSTPNNTTLSDYYMEIEGIQNTTNYLYFVLLPARVPGTPLEQGTTQYIYSLSKQAIEERLS